MGKVGVGKVSLSSKMPGEAGASRQRAVRCGSAGQGSSAVLWGCDGRMSV